MCARCPSHVSVSLVLNLPNSDSLPIAELKNALSSTLGIAKSRISNVRVARRRRLVATTVLFDVETDDPEAINDQVEADSFTASLTEALNDEGLQIEVIQIDVVVMEEQNTDSESDSSNLPMIIGLVAGCVVVFLIIVAIARGYCMKKQTKRDGARKGTIAMQELDQPAPFVKAWGSDDNEFITDDGRDFDQAFANETNFDEAFGEMSGTEKEFAKIASSGHFQDLLEEIDFEIEQAEVSRNLTYRKKREIFETVWRQKEGISFDMAILFRGALVISREGMERFLGEAVDSICVIHDMENIDDGLRMKGCFHPKNDLDVNVRSRIVNMIERSQVSAMNKLAQDFRLKDLPHLEIYDLNFNEIIRNFPASPRSEKKKLYNSAASSDATLNSTEEGEGMGPGKPQFFVEVTVNDKVSVNVIQKILSQDGVSSDTIDRSNASLFIVKGNFTVILQIKRDICDLNLESVSISEMIRPLGVE